MNRLAQRRAQHGSPLETYLLEINDTPLLSSEEERELAGQVAQGDPFAREHMVQANLRLVVNIARGYIGRGLSLEDLIAEGNLGLMRAVEGFDGNLGIRFCTYASYWIKQSIQRALINQGKPIRLPAHMAKLLAKWRRVAAVLTERLGRTPEPEEVGRALGLSKKKLNLVTKAIWLGELAPFTDGDGPESPGLDEVLADDRTKAPDDLLVESDDLERVFGRLERLEEREATVIRMRFGLGPYAPMTLREVGENLGMTRERARQLERQALARLTGGV
jgi:RNA polymerase primary sigma factor